MIFEPKNEKTPNGSVSRNAHSPRADRIQALLSITEGSGSDLDNKGYAFGGTQSDWDGEILDHAGAPVADDWDSDAEGPYIDLGETADQHYIGMGPTPSGSDLEILRGAMSLRFQVNTLSPGPIAQPILNSGGTHTRVGRLIIVLAKTTKDLVVTVNGGAGINISLTWYVADGFDPLAKHTLVFNWGESGFEGWCDGVAGTRVVTGDIVTTTSWSILDGFRMRIGRNQSDTYGALKVYTFGLWDMPLLEREVMELTSDPYATFRHIPTGFLASYINPVCGRPTVDGLSFGFATATVPDASGVTVRVLVSTSPAFDDYLAVEEVAINTDAFKRLIAKFSGLDPGTMYYWLAQWADGATPTTWYNMPGGRGCARTLRASTETSLRFCIVADDHVTNEIGGQPPHDGSIAMGKDILKNCGTTVGSPNTGSKLYLAWKHDRDLACQVPDFVVHVGDAYMTDSATIASLSSDDPSNIYNKVKAWRAFHNDLLKAGPFFLVIGNHDGEMGYKMRTLVDGYSLEQLSTMLRKTLVLNPTNSTYAQGGEDESGRDTDAGNDWVPAISSSFTVADKAALVTNADHDPDGLNDRPLENYSAFESGNCLFIFLDWYRYTEPGATDTSATRSSPTFRLGATQIAWLQGVLAESTVRHKFVFTHPAASGGSVGMGGMPGYYGRASGINISAAQDIVDGGVSHEFLEILRNGGVTAWFKGHDHKAAIVLKNDVNIVQCPTGSAPSMFNGLTGGWNDGRFPQEYGTPQFFGADQVDSGMRFMANVLGYLVVDVEADDVTITLRQTGHCPSSVDADDITTPGFQERWLGPQCSANAGAVTLSEQPTDVCAAVDATRMTLEEDQEWFDDDVTGSVAQTWPADQGYTTPSEFLTEDPAGGTLDHTDEAYGAADIELDDSFAGPIQIAHSPRTVTTQRLTAPPAVSGDLENFDVLEQDLIIAQHSKRPYSRWVFVKRDGQALSLIGKELRLNVYDPAYHEAVGATLTLTSAAGELVVIGENYNEVIAVWDEADTSQVRTLRYDLWNMTDHIRLATGARIVSPTVKQGAT